MKLKNSKFIYPLYKLFKLCKDLKLQICITALVLLLSSFLAIYPIQYLQKAIDISVNSLHGDSMKSFLLVSAVYLILHILNVFFTGIFQYLSANLEAKIGHKVRIELFSKLQSLTLSFYDDSTTGDLLVKLMQDSTITVDGILKPLIFILKELSMFVIGFYYMAKIDIGITLIMIPIGILLCFFITKTGPKIHSLSQDERDSNSILWSKFNEFIRGVKEVKSYGQEENSLNEISQSSLCTNKKILNLQKYTIVTGSINSAFFMGIICLIIVLGGYKVGTGALSIGGLSALMMYNGLLIDPMLNFTSFYQETQRILVSIERIFSILDKEGEYISKEDSFNENIFYNKLEVKELCFAYKDTKILNNVSFTINKGEKVAFVGESGSGKSTMCKLLMGFYTAQEGKISFDNKNINDISLSKIRSTVGIVFQDTFLFSSSLRENLLFVNKTATEEDLNRALEISGINLFLDKLPKGLDTPLGENGMQLSGGERQRISIARVILKNPELIILDEATSSLDPITTSKIIRDLLIYFENKTIIFTVHKLSNIAQICDNILLYNKGELLEEGTHEELMRKKSMYSKLYLAQFIEENS